VYLGHYFGCVNFEFNDKSLQTEAVRMAIEISIERKIGKRKTREEMNR